ncbi:MAG: ParB/RepB/Spo0J family partition protein, partial [Pirellulales bacterium]|nr:ParB/RepB/Spo0J family partition protein [Pirellulales bacterium]
MTFAFANMKVVEIPLDKLTADPDQPRKNFAAESIEELAASMGQHGQIYPLFVIPFNDHFQIVDGERRWRALSKAGIKHARTIVLSDKPEPAQLQLLQVVSNCQRSDLTSLELADAYARLMETAGFTVTQLAQALSRSKGHVSSILGLHKLVPDVRELVASGKIAGTAATQVARLPQSEQLAMAQEFTDGHIDRSQLERRV